MDDEMNGTKTMGVTQATLKRKKNLIGSVRNNNLNYPKDQKFFHGTDVPEKARQAVIEMKEATDKDIFKLKRPKWNASVSKAKVPIDDNDENNLFAIRKGFKDFHPLDNKHGKVYEGADTRNDYTGWNVSNQVPIPLHRQKMIYEE